MNNFEDSNRMFKCSDFFMIRTPLLPESKYRNVFQKNLSDNEIEDEIIKVCNEPLIKEAILTSSISLYDAINKLDSYSNNDKKKQVIASLMKYFIRMTTRTTPFGLFSGVTVGNFNNKTKVFLDSKEKYKKRARPDMEWLYSVMKKIECDTDILQELYVSTNSLSLENGDRLDNYYISNYGQSSKELPDNDITSSIRLTNQVKNVLNIAKNPIKYIELFNIMMKNNPNIDNKVIHSFLLQLIGKEYLLTSIRPSLVNTEQFDYVIKKIENIQAARGIYLQLIEVKSLIDRYNKCILGEGISLHNEIILKMKKISECKNYLQIDLKVQEKEAFISESVGKELEKAVQMLFTITTDIYEPHYLKKYKNEFVDKYGTDCEIPVLELLDEDKGLGAPYTYRYPISNKSSDYAHESESNKRYHKFLINKVLDALKNNKDEVVIYDNEVNDLAGQNNKKNNINDIPLSLEVNALIAANSEKDIDDGNYNIFIGPNGGSGSAGKTFGRFMDILPKSIHNEFKYINSIQQNVVGDDVVFAELVELPQSGRTSNVSLNCSYSEYEIAIATNCSGTKKTLAISDLFICIDKKAGYRFYIKSKTLNKRIIITTNNMLNIMSGGNSYRFLREVSTIYTIDIFEKLFNNGLQSFCYVPRIKYGKVILSPSVWIISNSILGLKNMDFNNFIEKFMLWKEKWKVPKYVYLKEADNRLLINTDNKLHLQEIFHNLKKNQNIEITITETEDGFENTWVCGKDGKYFCEFTFPLIRNDIFFIDNKKLSSQNAEVLKTESNYQNNRTGLSQFNKKRVVFPGEEWLFIKFYGSKKRVEEFIGYELKGFCNQLLSNGDIEKYFFIRYGDPDFNIRLRIKGKQDVLYSVVMKKLNTWFNHLKSQGLLTRICFDTYIKEMERYGGPDLIDLAEDVFFEDSVFVANIIELKRSNNLKLDLNAIGIASIVNMLEELGINYEAQSRIFMQNFDKNAHREIFKANRKLFMNVANSQNNYKTLRELEGGEVIYNLFDLRKQSLNNFAKEVEVVDKQNRLSNSKIDILFSLMHMHCNRLMGSNVMEEILLSQVRHSLQAVEFTRNMSKR